MDKLRCIVVDDEPLAVSLLENYISKTSFLDLEASFNDPVAALEEICFREPQLLFLDIQMPDLDGMELSRMIPESTKVIFTTAFKQYAFESYEVSALDFLLKPIRYKSFLEAALKAKEWFDLKEAASGAAGPRQSGAQEYVFVKSEGSMHKVMLDDILYIGGMKDYVMVYLRGKKFPLVTHVTMKAAEEMLPKDRFMRIHKSTIVALDKITAISPTLDVSINEKLLHVSDAYRESFEEYLSRKSFNG